MKTASAYKLLSFLLCIVLTVATALLAVGCGSTNNEPTTDTAAQTAPTEKPTVLGEGEIVFYFNVVDQNNKVTPFEIHTDAITVGEALQALKLIDGEEGDYGLYVKTVNGITLDYKEDGMYWSFYIGEDCALTGVDQTTAADGETYAFKAEAA